MMTIALQTIDSIYATIRIEMLVQFIIGVTILGLFAFLAFFVVGMLTARKSEKKIAQELAGEEMTVYKRIRYEKPSLQGEELYKAILTARYNCDDKRADEIIKMAKNLVNKEKDTPLDLRFITWALAISEFERIRPYPLTMPRRVEMLMAIVKIIPKNV